ncbi:DUF1801 domain-containing protein [Tabrizicola sp.]|uniref:DUF1801 domain-containing protein n=1 Tax=Tabrizicola sp. TaxID=2005166 RepID=UPI00286A6B45|nr:DUF1801 domain-containing protein [Tabrizicola sp.]
MNPQVRAAFDTAPPSAREGMLALRQLILDVAAGLPEVGRIEESLRWGEPAYLTPETRSGSTIRIGAPLGGGFALYCNCKTTLIAGYRDLAGPAARTQGNRAVLFASVADIDAALISILIARALMWHLPRRG